MQWSSEAGPLREEGAEDAVGVGVRVRVCRLVAVRERRLAGLLILLLLSQRGERTGCWAAVARWKQHQRMPAGLECWSCRLEGAAARGCPWSQPARGWKLLPASVARRAALQGAWRRAMRRTGASRLLVPPGWRQAPRQLREASPRRRGERGRLASRLWLLLLRCHGASWCEPCSRHRSCCHRRSHLWRCCCCLPVLPPPRRCWTWSQRQQLQQRAPGCVVKGLVLR